MSAINLLLSWSINMKFSSGILVLASVVISSFAASIPNIKADLLIVSSYVNALDKSVSALPSKGATIGQAIVINSNVQGLGALLDKGTKDIQSAPHFSEGDGKAILNSFRGSARILVDILSKLITKRATIKALPVPGITGLVRQGLEALHSRLGAFSNALMASEPNDVKGEVKKLMVSVDAAFAKAIAAFT